MSILIIGNFGYSSGTIGGQTIKTRNILNLYLQNSDKLEVKYFDIDSLNKNKGNLLRLLFLFITSSDIIFIPGQKFLKSIFIVLMTMNSLFRKRIKLFAVGGWLNDFLINNPRLIKYIGDISCVFVESKALRESLISNFKFNNIITFPNFRIHDFSVKKQNDEDIFKIVFMARITESKGVKILFDLMDRINLNNNEFKKKITLNFYGPIEGNFEFFFRNQLEIFDNVFYHGLVKPELVYEKLSDNDVCVLPTFHEGEGFPGTIVDSYIAGIPVIISRWKNLPEFVDEGINGFVFDLNKKEELYDYIKICVNDNILLSKMKKQALLKSKEYSAEKAWEILKQY